MTIVNAILARGLDLLLWPVADRPLLALAVVSLLTAAGILVVFRFTSDQRQLAAVKRAIQAVIFEIRLFSDDPRALLRAELEMLRHTLTYLRLSIVPMLVAALALGPLIAHLDLRFGYGGLLPGRPALIEAELREGAVPGRAVDPDAATGEPTDLAAALETPSAVSVETPAVWFPQTGEVTWRIVPQAPGEHVLGVRIGDQVFAKTLHVSDTVLGRSPVRPAAGFLSQLTNPGEAPLPEDGPLDGIAVSYPRRGVHVLGRELHWLIVYAAMSLLLSLVLRRPLGVTI